MASLLAGAGNPFARLWRSYERCLERRPVATQSVTSGALWALGDVLAQKFTSDSKQPLDVRRAALTGVFGGAVIGPAGTWWYAHLDRFAALFGTEGTLRFLLAKLAADWVLSRVRGEAGPVELKRALAPTVRALWQVLCSTREVSQRVRVAEGSSRATRLLPRINSSTPCHGNTLLLCCPGPGPGAPRRPPAAPA